MASVDTLPELLRPLMAGTSVTMNRCAICGRRWPLNQHHVVRRGAGKVWRGGVEVPKPTITLCGSGNASGCHGLAHANRLHFRWVENRHPAQAYAAPTVPGGHWEWLLTDEPTPYAEALGMDGWRKLPGRRTA